ncbi:hypothetical protein B4U80_00738 [Leptotrombidium deliense]|uniref:Peptidase M28 domain-containing protein n=1 Tax=Leptotrombidium deliense TaxID=299467 RepID=A0A443SJM5_9ACAR|nr:hypothetical protein B4U80_00738 [Leptotrombidium deliense]
MLTRHSQQNYENKVEVRNMIAERLQDLGLIVKTQEFATNGFSGTNIISLLPSKHYGTSSDTILVVGAHYDTVESSPGIDDNGSGCVATLEIARILAPLKYNLSATVYFVFFDEEESGKYGSINFVKHYLIPKLKKTSAVFVGSFVIDMVMHYDSTPYSQKLPTDVKQLSPYVNEWMDDNLHRGNFLGVLSRKNTGDEILSNALHDAWNAMSKAEYKLLPLIADIPWNSKKWRKWFLSSSYCRSDHASFWNVNTGDANYSLPAVMLWDLGVWRGKQANCYHRQCDDKSQLTNTNLTFLSKLINAVTAATLNLVAV